MSDLIIQGYKAWEQVLRLRELYAPQEQNKPVLGGIEIIDQPVSGQTDVPPPDTPDYNFNK